ncbi:hypothetical protein pb186bvf_000011 [Paramecium bursaria]
MRVSSYCIEYNDKITELCKNIMMPSGYIQLEDEPFQVYKQDGFWIQIQLIFLQYMNDFYVPDLDFDIMNEGEKDIVKYLTDRQLIFMTDPQQKQLEYEFSKRKLVFSLRSLDSIDTESSDLATTPPQFSSRTLSINLKKSPLKMKRLSVFT